MKLNLCLPLYDYTNQAWVVDGKYQRCGHPATMQCQCFGKLHAGEQADMNRIQKEISEFIEANKESMQSHVWR